MAAELNDIPLEELINIKVTSVSKHAIRLEDSPAAITVITQDDLRRLGVTSIPEALRSVPGLDVARINASQWAVSSRGFNNQYANKLLVLVDGRSVYTPSFSGVYWGMQDLMLADLDRIEVIRGPGAALWGANAVNGVINITSKSAKDTQGFLGRVTYGTELQPLTSLRYGGQLGTNLYYRVYGQFLNHGNFRLANGTEAHDNWDSARGGVRLDWQPTEPNHLTLQGDYNHQRVNQTFNEAQLTPAVGVITEAKQAHNSSGNLLGRWTHGFESGAESSLQIYLDAFKHVDAESVERRTTFDVDWQHRLSVGSRNEVTWGLGYRYTRDNIPPSDGVTFVPQQTHLQIFSAFLQDEIKLVPDKLNLTLGSKFEHNDYTGWEIQPSGRLLWMPTAKQTLWGAVSRAVRTPNRLEEGGRINTAAFQPPFSPPILVALLAKPGASSEELIAYELGYRVQPIKRLALDIATYYNTYHDLNFYIAGASQFEATPPPPHVLAPLQRGNSGAGDTYGVELQAQWQATDAWRLTAGYTWLQMRLGQDTATERANPQHQFSLRSYLDLSKNVEINTAAYYVDQISRSSGAALTAPSYIRLDLGVTWRPTKNLELSVWGQNLVNDRHSEFFNVQTSYLTEVPRSVFGTITLRF